MAGSGLKVLGVTVLTSLTAEDLIADDHSLSPADLVERRVRQALDAGIDGVVASPHEAARVKALAVEAGRDDFLIVTPGVRPEARPWTTEARAAPEPPCAPGRPIL